VVEAEVVLLPQSQALAGEEAVEEEGVACCVLFCDVWEGIGV